MRIAATLVLVREGPASPEVLLLRRSEASRSFAGAWVFPGGGVEPVDREAGNNETDWARHAAIRETREECGLTVSPDSVTPMSCWVPPLESPVQLRTHHFVARAPQESQVVVDGVEIVDAQWLPPESAMARHAIGELILLPPTWMTLHELASRPDVASAVAAREGDLPIFRTRIETHDGVSRLSWLDADQQLDISALPWRLVPQRSTHHAFGKGTS